MALTITIDGDDHSGSARLESVVMVEMAFGGEVGQGGFDRDDVALDDVPALKDATVEEDEDVGDERMFTGVSGVRGLDRGNFRQETNRSWDVNLWDLNAVLDDEIFQSDGANRPAETDYQRISWLIGTGAMDELGITAGVIPNTNTVDMDAVDYRGQGPRQVLDECAEAATKNYFVYDWGDGPKLYYDQQAGTSLTSDLSLSTVLDDVDNSTCFAINLDAHIDYDPSDVYSKIRFKYASGTVWVEDTDTRDMYRRREVAIEDGSVKSAAKATAKATAYLEAHSTEKQTLRLSTILPADTVNSIHAGMRINLKIPHLNIAEFTYKRATRCEKTPAPAESGVSSEFYLVSLEFEDVRLVGNGRGGDGTGEEVALDRYQLVKEDGATYGSDPYYTIDPDFDFGALGSTDSSEVRQGPEHNVPWPYTPWFLTTTAVGGLVNAEAWYRFSVDLTNDFVTGVRVDVGFDSTYDLAIGTDTIAVGVYSYDAPTDKAQYTLVSVIGSDGGTVRIDRSLLRDATAGYCWAVIAPNTGITEGLYGGADVSDPAPHMAAVTDNNSDAPLNVRVRTLVSTTAAPGFTGTGLEWEDV